MKKIIIAALLLACAGCKKEDLNTVYQDGSTFFLRDDSFWVDPDKKYRELEIHGIRPIPPFRIDTLARTGISNQNFYAVTASNGLHYTQMPQMKMTHVKGPGERKFVITLSK